MHGAVISSLSGLGILTGGSIGGILAKPLGFQKWQMVATMAIGGALLACRSQTLRFLSTASLTNRDTQPYQQPTPPTRDNPLHCSSSPPSAWAGSLISL